MGSAGMFIWAMVVILALAWALVQTGTVNLGVDFNLWVNILLVLAVLGVIFNLFIVPFLSRSRTTSSSAHTAGSTAPGVAPTAVPPGTVVPGAAPGAPATGAASQEVVQETRDRTTL